MLSHLFNPIRDGDDIQNPEFLIAEHLEDNINIGTNSRFGSGPGTVTSLDDIFTHWVSINDPDQLELFENLCNQYSDFVFQFPWWSVDIIEDEGGIINDSMIQKIQRQKKHLILSLDNTIELPIENSRFII